MRSTVCMLLVAAAGFLTALPSQAQNQIRFDVEGRAKFSIPEGQWNDNNDIDSGYGFGVNAQVWMISYFGIYGGWEWVRFPISQNDPSVDASVSDTGFRAGIMTPYFRGLGPLGPFIFVGGLLNQTSFKLTDRREFLGVTSNRELGREIGAGVTIPWGAITLVPTVSYRTYDATFGSPDVVGGFNETTVSHLMLDLGMRLNVSR